MKYMLLYVYVFMYLAHAQLDSLSSCLSCNKDHSHTVPDDEHRYEGVFARCSSQSLAPSPSKCLLAMHG